MDDVRKQRIENAIKEKLQSMIMKGDIKDPGINSMVTVSRVSITKDLSFAKVFVSFLFEGESLLKVVKAFERASGFIRSELARSLQLRHTPQLRFLADETLADSFHMIKKLESLSLVDNQEEKNV